MEPITVIMSALATGIALGAKDAASEAIRDAYKGLKDLLVKKLSRDHKEFALEKYENQPTMWSEPLKEILESVQADKDEEITKSSTILMQLAKEREATLQKFDIQVFGNIQGIVQGDHGNVKLEFRNEFKKE